MMHWWSQPCAARDTRKLVVAAGARHQVPAVFGELFGDSPCIVIADENTFAAAGKDVQDGLRASGRKCLEPLVMEARGLYAEYSYVTRIQKALADNEAIPVAVGSGSINDLTKLASHLCGRQYLSVATAASMDGYTAFGASITHEGSKQTFDCPAPIGVVADLEVIAAAPKVSTLRATPISWQKCRPASIGCWPIAWASTRSIPRFGTWCNRGSMSG